MAFYRGKAGGVGIFTGTLPAYGVDPGSVTDQLWCYTADSEDSAEIYKDTNTANAQEEATLGTIIRRNTPIALSGPLADTAFPILMGFWGGADGRTAVGSGYQYAQTLSGLSAETPNTALYINPGSASAASSPTGLCHLGAVLDSLTISGNSQSGIYEFNSSWATSGAFGTSRSIASADKPVLPQFMFERSYLFSGADGGMVPMTVEQPTSTSAPTGTSITSPENWTPYLRSFSWTGNNNLDLSIGHGTGSDTYAISRPRTARSQSVSMSFVWDSTIANILALRTGVASIRCFDLMAFSNTLAAAGCYFGFAMKFPRLLLESAKMGGGLGIKTIDTVWTPLGTAGSANGTVYGYGYTAATAAGAGGYIN